MAFADLVEPATVGCIGTRHGQERLVWGAERRQASGGASRLLDDWIEHIRNYADAEDQGYQWADMFALTYGQLAEHIDEIVLKFEQVINELKALEPEPEPE